MVYFGTSSHLWLSHHKPKKPPPEARTRTYPHVTLNRRTKVNLRQNNLRRLTSDRKTMRTHVGATSPVIEWGLPSWPPYIPAPTRFSRCPPSSPPSIVVEVAAPASLAVLHPRRSWTRSPRPSITSPPRWTPRRSGAGPGSGRRRPPSLRRRAELLALDPGSGADPRRVYADTSRIRPEHVLDPKNRYTNHLIRQSHLIHLKCHTIASHTSHSPYIHRMSYSHGKCFHRDGSACEIDFCCTHFRFFSC